MRKETDECFYVKKWHETTHFQANEEDDKLRENMELSP